MRVSPDLVQTINVALVISIAQTDYIILLLKGSSTHISDMGTAVNAYFSYGQHNHTQVSLKTLTSKQMALICQGYDETCPLQAEFIFSAFYFFPKLVGTQMFKASFAWWICIAQLSRANLIFVERFFFLLLADRILFP